MAGLPFYIINPEEGQGVITDLINQNRFAHFDLLQFQGEGFVKYIPYIEGSYVIVDGEAPSNLLITGITLTQSSYAGSDSFDIWVDDYYHGGDNIYCKQQPTYKGFNIAQLILKGQHVKIILNNCSGTSRNVGCDIFYYRLDPKIQLTDIAFGDTYFTNDNLFDTVEIPTGFINQPEGGFSEHVQLSSGILHASNLNFQSLESDCIYREDYSTAHTTSLATGNYNLKHYLENTVQTITTIVIPRGLKVELLNYNSQIIFSQTGPFVGYNSKLLSPNYGDMLFTHNLLTTTPGQIIENFNFEHLFPHNSTHRRGIYYPNMDEGFNCYIEITKTL